MVVILTPIYEAEFLGFNYGFRPGRGQHDALDALAYGINARKINWILDADISRFFDTLSREWLIRLVEHRIGDRRIIRLIQKWLKAGVLEDGRLIETTEAPRKAQWHHHCLRTCISITSTISGSSSGARATQGAI
jgi:RNA-directed DNA polymerase